MSEKLPNVFVNVNDNINDNNVSYYYSKNGKNILQKKEAFSNRIKINKKIDELFNSTKFVYKLPVLITLEDEKIDTVIVYKNKNELVTMDNRVIKVEEILDINEKKL